MAAAGRVATVAAAQIRATPSVSENLKRITRNIQRAAEQSADVVVFPETCVTGYFPEYISRVAQIEVERAIDTIRQACSDASISAVVGSPVHAKGQDIRNSALIVGPEGECIGEQAKMQLVPTDDWAVAGKTLNTVKIPLRSGEKLEAAVIICHDSRYPELVRLPVLCGARCIFYLSWETWYNDEPVPLVESELSPYRAQVQARAVENRVFVVHANVPANMEERGMGSHGTSRIVDPLGRVLLEASHEKEELLVREIDLDAAVALYARKSLLPDYALREWWEKGLPYVRQGGV